MFGELDGRLLVWCRSEKGRGHEVMGLAAVACDYARAVDKAEWRWTRCRSRSMVFLQAYR